MGSNVKKWEDISVGSGVLPRREEGKEDDASEAADDGTSRNASKVSSLLVPARPSGGRRDDHAERFQPTTGGRKRRRNSNKGVVSGNSSSCGDSISIGRWSSTDHGGNCEKDQGGEAENTPELPPPDRSDVRSADVWSMLDNYVHRRAEVAKANRHVQAIEVMRRVRRGAFSFCQTLDC